MYVSHLACPKCENTYESEKIMQVCDGGSPLLVRYHLNKISTVLKKEDLTGRKPDLWRYRELLPVKHLDNIINLGEGMAPLA
jgi:threonine synthase